VKLVIINEDDYQVEATEEEVLELLSLSTEDPNAILDHLEQNPGVLYNAANGKQVMVVE